MESPQVISILGLAISFLSVRSGALRLACFPGDPLTGSQAVHNGPESLLSLMRWREWGSREGCIHCDRKIRLVDMN